MNAMSRSLSQADQHLAPDPSSPVLNYRSGVAEADLVPHRVEAIHAQRADAVRDLIGWTVVLIAVVALCGVAWTMAQ